MAIVLTTKDVSVWDGKRIPEAGEILYIPLEHLRAIGNPRNDIKQEDIDELLNSIKAVGQLVESLVVVKKEGKGEDEKIVFGVAGGNQRWAACVLGKIKTLRCKIADPKSDKDLFLLKTVDNCARKGYSLFDTIEMVREAKEVHGMSNGDIAHAMGWSSSYVAQLTNMLALHPDILQRARPTVPKNKRLSLLTGQPLAALDHKQQLEFIDRVTGNISDARARAIIDHTLAAQGRARAGKHKKSPNKTFRNVASFARLSEEKLTLLLVHGPEKYAEMTRCRELSDVLKNLAHIERVWNMLAMLHERIRKARGVGEELARKEVKIDLFAIESKAEAEETKPAVTAQPPPIEAKPAAAQAPPPKPSGGAESNGKKAGGTSASQNGSSSEPPKQPKRHTTRKQRVAMNDRRAHIGAKIVARPEEAGKAVPKSADPRAIMGRSKYYASDAEMRQWSKNPLING